MRDLISHLAHGENLSNEQIEQAIAALLDESGDQAEKASFLKALRAKGETPMEIAGFVKALLAHCVDPAIDPARLSGPMIDICGTGGDRMGLFNVSTTVMFLLAAGGAVVVKHGNRGVTSKCGGADVLEALGARIDLPPEALRACVEQVGLGFMFAPQYHPAFKAIAPVRAALAAKGVTTLFNILGPLLNPARPERQLVGIFSETLLPRYADAMLLLGRKNAWVVHGSSGEIGNGMDELSTLGPTSVCKVHQGEVASSVISPDTYGIPRTTLEALRGSSDCAENARTVEGILAGEVHGAKRDLVVFNAAAGFVVAGIALDLAQGIVLAVEQLDSGAALQKLRDLQNFRG